MSTRTLRIDGVATALSSISHGGETTGTVANLRREKIVGADGVPVDVPVLSGNALRGVLRDHAAAVFHRALGSPELPVQVFHLLWSGGSLAKAGSGHVLGSRQLAEVRRLVPLVSLFGGSGAGKIIEGKLRVGKLMPVCAETAHLLPEDIAGAEHSIWEMTQIEEFTRRDDSKRDQLHPAIAGFGLSALTADTDGTLLAVAPHQQAVEAGVDGPAQQMRYGVETLAAGTRLHWWITLADVTDVEVALFAAAVDAWQNAGGAVGGRAATGHGRLRLDAHQWEERSLTTTVGTALAAGGTDVLTDHVTDERDSILEALGWFA